jgi:hypothetical protein
MDKTTLAVVITGIVGLFPLLANTLISIFQGRTSRAHRDDAITVAKQRIEFLDSWIKSQESVSTAEHLAELKQIASEELDDIRRGVLTALATTAAKPSRAADRHAVQRLFLMYRPHSIAGWVWHTLFYMTGAMCIAVVLLTVLSYDPTTLEGGVIIAVAFLILALIFRGLGALVDGWAEKKLQADTTQK